MNLSMQDEVSIFMAGVFVCVVLLLSIVIWSIRRHRAPTLHIEGDSPIEELIPSLAGLTLSTAVAGNSVEVLDSTLAIFGEQEGEASFRIEELSDG